MAHTTLGWMADQGWLAGQPWGQVGGIQIAPHRSEVAGETRLSPNKATIEPETFFCEYLKTGGLWEPKNSSGRMPLIIEEDHLRRVSFAQDDIITCRFDMDDRSPTGIIYDFENTVDYGSFRIFTRVSRNHAHLLTTELIRLLQSIRRDTYAIEGQVPGHGRDWLKVTNITKAEQTKRAFWHREVRIEVHGRWKPIITED